MAEQLQAKVLVVGGGPGGYVAAIRAGQLGLDTILVEGDQLGGTCLIRGCIPSKALIHAASEFHAMVRKLSRSEMGISLASAPEIDFAETVRWKEGIVRKLNNGVGALLKKAKVRVLHGWAKFSDAKTCSVTGADEATVKAEHVILATGSEPVALPTVPFGGAVISSTDALSLPAMPKRLVVIGAGYIGLELGIAFCKMGSEVTVIEALDRILPLYDQQLTDPVRKWMERRGMNLLLNSTAQRVEKTGSKGATIAVNQNGAAVELSADYVLVAVGRRPKTQGWGLENMAVNMDGRFVKIDNQCRTSMKNVWAIGDLTGEPMLAHRASAQGEMVPEIIAGERRVFEPRSIPAICFTEPEVVSTGLLPGEAETRKLDPIIGMFPFAANGRALSMQAGDDGGFVRVVARRDNHRILGIQAVGAHASELSGEFSLALEMDALLEDVALTIHAHPTLTEAFHEAALKTLGHAIHI